VTLIDDLEDAADHFEAVSRDMAPIKPMRADVAARSARLRAHAARLREEMQRKPPLARAPQWDHDMWRGGIATAEVINGGPLGP